MVKINPTAKPWITTQIKQLILERQCAYRWRELSFKVRNEIASKNQAVYPGKVSHLKSRDPRGREWLWTSSRARLVVVILLATRLMTRFSLTRSSQTDLTTFFFSVTHDIPALGVETLTTFLRAPDELPVFLASEIYKRLTHLSPHKAYGPDAISHRILKEFSFELLSHSLLSGWPLYPEVQRTNH